MAPSNWFEGEGCKPHPILLLRGEWMETYAMRLYVFNGPSPNKFGYATLSGGTLKLV